ncbi:hypothetical protein JKF63_01629 [Porcisia hertigi]|uniref:START domain-containing protein n=1 Tax=Porcisia hertigi TaxID=2761500 RepID=A0A836H526_9TRYP|nr:hypothetical protein JKF63_01629 [Porcisia hertigi]
MFKFISSVGDAAYKVAEKSGLAAGSQQPPYPCALPLQVIEDIEDTDTTERVLNDTYAAVQDLLSDDLPLLHSALSDTKVRKGFKQVDFTDRDGDIRLFTRPHVGSYNFARATFTLDDVTPAQVLTLMHAQNLNERKCYSNSIDQYDIITRNPKLPVQYIGNDNDHLEELCHMGIRDWHIEYNRYSAPPPVAARDFIYLVEKRYVPEQQCYYIYGTSVEYPDVKNVITHKEKCVRGAVLFGWRFQMVGRKTYCTYVSCMSPNGWAPTFLVGWMKTEIAKEFQCARRLLYKHLQLTHVAGASCEYTKDPPTKYNTTITSHSNELNRSDSLSRPSVQWGCGAMMCEERRLLEHEEPFIFE